jgi:hypothetical protein
MPAVGASVNVPVTNSSSFANGVYVWVEIAGEMKVMAKPDLGDMTLLNTGWAGNAAAGTVIPPIVQISPTGKSAGVP